MLVEFLVFILCHLQTFYIIGLISTLADAGATERLQIVGPQNTKHLIAAMRPFLHRANYAVAIDELSKTAPDYSDKNLKAHCIELSGLSKVTESSCSPEQKRRRSDGFEQEFGVENLDVTEIDSHHFLLKMFKDPSKYGENVPESMLSCREHYHQVESERMTQHSRLPRTSPTNSSLCYIFEGPETPGKFMSQVAKSLGVPHGPMNGRLQKGESITLDDGRIVTPGMCIGAPVPGPIFVYIDVPSTAHALDLLVKEPQFADLLDGGSKAARVKVVVHYVPTAIFESDVYKKGHCLNWPKYVEHFHIDESHHLVLESSAAIQNTLGSALDRTVYPFPYGEKIKAQPLVKFHWINTAKPQPLVDPTDSDSLSERFSLYSESNQLHSPPNDDCKITILGTGAALPGKYRNVSATLLTISNTKSYLLDCGEGTMGQILRAHGENYANIVCSIKLAFISHLHADHHAGFMGFLRERRQLGCTNRITIVAPQRYAIWLEEYSGCEEVGEYDFIASETLTESPFKMEDEDTFLCVPVEHCPRSFASVLTVAGKKYVFSGDTRPCQALVEAGSDADVLIHEATMGDDLQAEAIAKRHCTISEAIDVGNRMRAKHILLTHFSQRYAKTAPPIPSDATNVSVAFDLMRISVKNLSSLEGSLYNQKLRELLPDEEPPQPL